jgi:hypothetical protein
MASHGKAKEYAAAVMAPKEPATPAPAAHLHELHGKMAHHLAGLEEHLDGLHEAHAALGAHLGIPGGSNSETDKED